MKPFWLSAVETPQEPVQELMAKMKTYGLALKGHFWKDDLKKMAWADVKEGVADSQVSFWSILIPQKALENADIRYGLSMSALLVRALRGSTFPIVLIQTDGDPVSPEALPTLLQGAKRFSVSDPGLASKLVALAHSPVQKPSGAYHMGIHSDPQVGQWLEIRPLNEQWPGIIFGVTDAEIAFQAVGPAGGLPEKSVLNYPMEGLKVALGDTEYTAWAVKNELSPETSYYVKIDGHPDSILFGPYSEDDSTEMFVVKLK